MSSTSAIRECADHGYFDGEACPECGDPGERALGAARRERLSRYLSGALRHFPDDAGIELDPAGWTEFDALAAAAERQYGWADERAVAAVVETDPKGRFERANGRIRAAYGHSVDVEVGGGAGDVPDRLYHGTAPRNRNAILSEGLKPMNRKRVHLSDAPEAAREVGQRHTDARPIVFEVDAAALRADGYEVEKRGIDTYTARRVPPEFLSEVTDSNGA